MKEMTSREWRQVLDIFADVSENQITYAELEKNRLVSYIDEIIAGLGTNEESEQEKTEAADEDTP